MVNQSSFGQILRERRTWLGLTQAELARRSGCAPITIRKIEGDTLRPSVQLALLLAQSLKISDAEQAGFVQLARQEQPPTPIPAPAMTPQQIAALANPYQGLRPFAEADAENFCGQDRMIETLLDCMSDGSDAERFLAIVGPNGSGKSSLVNASLLPKVRQGKLPGSKNWLIVRISPGAKPWEELASALQQVASKPMPSLLADLQQDDRGLVGAVQSCLPVDDETELLLVIDQFEELFTLVEEEAVRELFLQSLVTAVLDPQSRLCVVITLRADFTHRLLQYRAFGELMQQRLIHVPQRRHCTNLYKCTGCSFVLRDMAKRVPGMWFSTPMGGRRAP
ncbi:helix-turn-helix domain-containing protein [Candidatus Leptofilum sp.]|uniref:nSTAND1 domain-containing NTPase n=1 Tax=Candidatus Leptofilum sp. TaxID=3241576 RepID=UPI003B5CDC44